MVACGLCGREKTTAEGCDPDLREPVVLGGEEYEPIRWEGRDISRGPCPDCAVSFGKYHHPGCDREKCPICGGQYAFCDCETDEKIELFGSSKDPFPFCPGCDYPFNQAIALSDKALYCEKTGLRYTVGQCFDHNGVTFDGWREQNDTEWAHERVEDELAPKNGNMWVDAESYDDPENRDHLEYFDTSVIEDGEWSCPDCDGPGRHTAFDMSRWSIVCEECDAVIEDSLRRHFEELEEKNEYERN